MLCIRVFEEKGLVGITKLAQTCGSPNRVGWYLAKLSLDMAVLIEWIAGTLCDLLAEESIKDLISCLMNGLCSSSTGILIRGIVQRGKDDGWEKDKVVRFLILAPIEKSTWEIISAEGSDLDENYWATVPFFWIPEKVIWFL